MIGGIAVIVVLGGSQWLLWTVAKSTGVIARDARLSHATMRGLYVSSDGDGRFRTVQVIAILSFVAQLVIGLSLQQSLQPGNAIPLVPAWSIAVAGLASAIYWTVLAIQRRAERSRVFWVPVGCVASSIVVMITGILRMGS